ncbi:hypothetical protein BV898_11164 [Hypsibius exemplaris]|uniref:C2 domain-containing protein n=1 Tax=Hypsibius exemplaris TaxID=2072580 RepID=A0A1W0WHH7_HYPEX|nr:hypothetical protein BV898_11164 [Hypsibius exemplaris]
MDSDSEQSDATTPPLSELSESPLVSVSDNETSEESVVSPSETADLSTATVDDSNSSQDDDERASRNAVHYKPPKDGPVRRQHRHPFGPNRDSMGNYVGPGGDQESLPVKGVKRLCWEKNMLMHRMRPHLEDVRSVGLKVSDSVKEKGTKLGIQLALRGVRYITGRQSGVDPADLTDDDDLDPQAPHVDPFDFDFRQLKVEPVAIPKLVVNNEYLASGREKTHAYFESRKDAMYNAVMDQAASKVTKEIAAKLKKKETKPKEKQVKQVEPPLNRNAIEPLTTRIIGKTINPKWKEVFELSGVPPIGTLMRQTLHIDIYDYDQIGADDHVGYVDIGFATYDLKENTDMWFDLRTKENEEFFKVRGHILIGLRYDEKHEQLTVFLERCHGLEKPGWLMMRGSLHINGFLVKEERAKIEQITSINPELKRRMVFSKVQRTLLDEYTVSVYLAFRKYFSYYKFFGQVNLSSKSKIKDEEAIWREAVKLPGEAAFKQLAIQPFVGLVKKPWTADEVEAEQSIGFLHVTLKTSNMGSGIIITCTFDKAEELRLPQGNVIFVEIFIVKDHICLAKESTLSKKVGQKVTAIEEQFDFPVEMEDVQQVELLAVVFQKTFSGKEALGRNLLSS